MSQHYYAGPSYDGSHPPAGSFRSEYYEDYEGDRRGSEGGALDALRHAKEHAFGAVSETVSDAGRRAKDASYAVSGFVGTHAVPLTLLGLGLGLLMVSTSRQRAGGEPIRVPGLRSQRHLADEQGQPRARLMERAHELSDDASARVGAVTQRAQHTIQDVRAQAQHLGHDAREQIQSGLSTLSRHAHEIGDHTRELGHDLREQATQLGHQGYDQLTQLGHQGYDQLTQLGQQGYDQLRKAQERTEQLIHENPLVVGALAIVAGVGVGMLLPATRRENQLLGQTRDRLLHDAQATASRLGETAQHAAHELKSALLEQAP